MAQVFAQVEGYVPAPETAHVLSAIKEIADETKRTGKKYTKSCKNEYMNNYFVSSLS
jgi:predicted alternative tryptophan synthase beta-subunit